MKVSVTPTDVNGMLDSGFGFALLAGRAANIIALDLLNYYIRAA